MILKTNFTDAIRIMRNSGQSVFSEENKKKFGTIYTPEFVVEKTVDLAWKYLPEGVDKLDLTYCDPAVGDGNFLEYLYEKLMQETSIEDPIKRSRYILTKCLFGFEILEPMVQACKIRMIMLHQHTINQHGGDRDELLTLFDELQIYHGNTICLPADTEQEWYQARQEDEGGLLPEELRERKFDVIVGNPPYTHLRNLANRRYAAYPKQRDLAQVFVRWALDHLTETGVCGYNTIDTWLNVKTCDGAIETRQLVYGRLLEALADVKIRTYSENQQGIGGGEIPTFIVCFGPSSVDFIVDGQIHQYDGNLLLEPGFLQRLQNRSLIFKFKHTTIDNYIGQLRGIRSPNKHGSNTHKWKSFIYDEYGETAYWLVSKSGIYEHTYAGNWKLIKADDFGTFKARISTDLESEIKVAAVSALHGLWLVGYLNTTTAKSYVQTYCKLGANHGGWLAVLAAGTIRTCRVPDFDYYKQDRPERFQAYMSWVEANMRDKDAFLAGIDEQFEKLIENTEG